MFNLTKFCGRQDQYLLCRQEEVEGDKKGNKDCFELENVSPTFKGFVTVLLTQVYFIEPQDC